MLWKQKDSQLRVIRKIQTFTINHNKLIRKGHVYPQATCGSESHDVPMLSASICPPRSAVSHNYTIHPGRLMAAITYSHDPMKWKENDLNHSPPCLCSSVS